MRPKSFVTPNAGSSLIHSVPASWCVVPSRSRRAICGWSAARSAAVAPAGTGMVRPPEAMMISKGCPFAKISATSSVRASIASQTSRSNWVCWLPPAGCRESPISTNARGRPFLPVGRGFGQVDEAVRVLRRHLPDAAQGDDGGLVIGLQHRVELLQAGDLLEQLGFGVVAEPPETGRGDLQVEVPVDAADGDLALDE